MNIPIIEKRWISVGLGVVGSCVLPLVAFAFTSPTFISDHAISPAEGHGVSIVSDSANNIYALLSDGATVQKFDVNFNPLPFAGTGTGTGIAVYAGANADPSDDHIYVADRTGNRINVFGVNGNFLFQFGSSGASKGQFAGTIGAIEIDQATGDVYVFDGLGFARIQKFDAAGNFLRTWGWGVKTNTPQYEICTAADAQCFPGLSGSGAGQLQAVGAKGGIATDGSSVYVADTRNFRIIKYDTSGNYVATWGTAGNGDGQFATSQGPTGVRYHNGLVYVTDSYPNNRVQTFDTNGVFQGKWGTSATMSEPTDIAIISTGVIFVADFFPSQYGRLSKWTSADPQATTKDQCKNGGFSNYVGTNGQAFTNQGQCVSYVNHL